MSRFTPIDLAAYPVTDVLEALSFEVYLARDRAELAGRWNARRLTRPELPAFDTLLLDSDPSSVVLQVGTYREMILRARVNDALRSLTLAGAMGRALDHIGVTYFRTTRRVITPASGSVSAVMEDDETYRQRLALAPESWSTAGPVGAYLFWGLSASGDVLDIAAYSEDEGVCLAPAIRIAVLSRSGSGIAPPATLDAVRRVLNRRDIRPMSDEVIVESAEPFPFDLTIHLTLRYGATSGTVLQAARARIEAYCSGRLRWIGDGLTGPVWLIGRTFSVESLAGVAMGGDPNILEANVQGGDINPPHPGYTEAALAGVGSTSFMALPEIQTAHLRSAPKLGTLTLTHGVAVQGWAS